jgi:hypothetical protein
MEEKDYEELKEMVELRHLHPAINEETGAPVLSRVRNQPGLGYVHLQTFVNALEEKGLTISKKTLNIRKKPETKPATKTPPKKEEKTEEKPTPGPKLYTKAQLEKLSYKELQAIAKKDPDVPADKKKAELVKLLTGRPIL